MSKRKDNRLMRFIFNGWQPGWMRKSQSTISDAFAKVVKRHREPNGLSRVALAEKAGLHQTYIGLLERQKRSPNLDRAKAIAKSLGLPLAKMISEAERI